MRQRTLKHVRETAAALCAILASVAVPVSARAELPCNEFCQRWLQFKPATTAAQQPQPSVDLVDPGTEPGVAEPRQSPARSKRLRSERRHRIANKPRGQLAASQRGVERSSAGGAGKLKSDPTPNGSPLSAGQQPNGTASAAPPSPASEAGVENSPKRDDVATAISVNRSKSDDGLAPAQAAKTDVQASGAPDEPAKPIGETAQAAASAPSTTANADPVSMVAGAAVAKPDTQAGSAPPDKPVEVAAEPAAPAPAPETADPAATASTAGPVVAEPAAQASAAPPETSKPTDAAPPTAAPAPAVAADAALVATASTAAGDEGAKAASQASGAPPKAARPPEATAQTAASMPAAPAEVDPVATTSTTTGAGDTQPDARASGARSEPTRSAEVATETAAAPKPDSPPSSGTPTAAPSGPEDLPSSTGSISAEPARPSDVESKLASAEANGVATLDGSASSVPRTEAPPPPGSTADAPAGMGSAEVTPKVDAGPATASAVAEAAVPQPNSEVPVKGEALASSADRTAARPSDKEVASLGSAESRSRPKAADATPKVLVLTVAADIHSLGDLDGKSVAVQNSEPKALTMASLTFESLGLAPRFHTVEAGADPQQLLTDGNSASLVVMDASRVPKHLDEHTLRVVVDSWITNAQNGDD